MLTYITVRVGTVFDEPKKCARCGAVYNFLPCEGKETELGIWFDCIVKDCRNNLVIPNPGLVGLKPRN